MSVDGFTPANAVIRWTSMLTMANRHKRGKPDLSVSTTAPGSKTGQPDFSESTNSEVEQSQVENVGLCNTTDEATAFEPVEKTSESASNALPPVAVFRRPASTSSQVPTVALIKLPFKSAKPAPLASSSQVDPCLASNEKSDLSRRDSNSDTNPDESLPLVIDY